MNFTKLLSIIAMVLLIIGGINWGLIGFFHYNLVTTLFGDKMLARIIYGLVGLSAVYVLLVGFKGNKTVWR
jgi:uncharacterized protein